MFHKLIKTLAEAKRTLFSPKTTLRPKASGRPCTQGTIIQKQPRYSLCVMVLDLDKAPGDYLEGQELCTSDDLGEMKAKMRRFAKSPNTMPWHQIQGEYLHLVINDNSSTDPDKIEIAMQPVLRLR